MSSQKFQDKIALDPSIDGSMFVPVVAGSDKTTVSVATGHQEYYPVYISPGIITNTGSRGHGNGVLPRDCHGLLYPAGYSRRARYGYGMGLSNPGHTCTPSWGLAGRWRVGTFKLHAKSLSTINPNDARRIVWALCRYVF